MLKSFNRLNTLGRVNSTYRNGLAESLALFQTSASFHQKEQFQATPALQQENTELSMGRYSSPTELKGCTKPSLKACAKAEKSSSGGIILREIRRKTLLHIQLNQYYPFPYSQFKNKNLCQITYFFCTVYVNASPITTNNEE